MSRSSLFENKAFQSSPGIGFNIISQVSTFNSVFDTKPLDSEEAALLEKILDDGSGHEVTPEQSANDFTNLKQITAEIKAIAKQGTILLGERVHRAREILKPYKDGTFTRWLEAAFGTRKTGYNVLAYYELFMALPRDDLRNNFKKLQHRTAYILASREGDIEAKAAILRECHDKSHDELVSLIQEKLPISKGDKRTKKILIETLLSNMREVIGNLHHRKSDLTDDNKTEIEELKGLLASLLLDNAPIS